MCVCVCVCERERERERGDYANRKDFLEQSALSLFRYERLLSQIKRIHHRSSMQTEKSKPEGKRIMPETRFIELPASFVDPRVEISWSGSEA